MLLKLDTSLIRSAVSQGFPATLASLVLGLAISQVCVAQMHDLGGGQGEEEIEPAPIFRAIFEPGELENKSAEELQTIYNETIEELRQHTKDLRREGTRYFHATSDESLSHKDKWQAIADQSKRTYQKLKEVSLALYQRTAKPDESLSRIALGMAVESVEDGRLTLAGPVLDKLVKQFPDMSELRLERGKVAAMTNQFAEASRYAESHQRQIAELPPFERSMFGKLETQKLRWQREQEIRQQEAKQDDLPRVEIETSKGKIVIELFEDHAPNSVANFVSLIQSGFYDNLIFHRVFRNYRVGGGLLTLNELRSTGYEIASEADRPDARDIFRGSVSLVTDNNRTKGSSEFYINLAPEPFIETDEKDTVIGRVVEGMDIVERINVTAKLTEQGQAEVYPDAKPDRIVSTRVLRKRPDSKYEPEIAEK